MRVIIYHDYIPKVGGIESAVYNLAKGLDDEGYDVTVAYRSAESAKSLYKYSEVADVVCVDELEVEGDVCIQASNHRIHKNVKTDRYLQWVHSDYAKYNLRLKNLDYYNEGKLKYVAVTEYCKRVIEKQEGIENTEVILNLIDKEFGKVRSNRLKLVTASRVSPEKGFGRMLALAEALKEKDVDFIWFVYGDNSHFPKEYRDWINKFSHIEEVYFVGYKSDVTPLLFESDYLVQLSDWEGCPYSVLEALKVEKPCIVSEWGGVTELIQDGKNGYILPMKTENYTQYVDKIVDNIPSFKYKPLSKISEWVKLIENGV